MRYTFNNIIMDVTQFEILSNGNTVAVEPKVFDLILYLIKNRDRLISRDELFSEVWKGREVSDASLSNHIKSARKVLEDNAEEQKVIKTIRGRGYQFIAQTQEVTNTQIKPNLKALPKNRYRLAIALMVSSLGIIFLFNYAGDKTNTVSNNRLAVLPFKNLKADPPSDYLGFAIADQVIGNLAYINKLTVRPSGIVQKYQHQVVDVTTIGQQLNIEYVLMGTYVKENNNIRLNIELINVRDGELLWRESLVEKFNNIFHIQDLVAKRVAEYFKIRFYQQKMLNASSEQAIDSLAYRHYLRAIAFPYTIDGAKQAITHLEKSRIIAPNFAPNYVELGKRTNFITVFELGDTAQKKQALNYYKKALTLNPKLRSALNELAKSYIEVGKTYQSIELTKQLLQLNKNDAQAHYSLGYVYRYLGMLPESIRQMTTAISLDPKDEWFHNLAVTYISNGDYEKAFDALSKGEPTAYSLAWKATIYIHQKKSTKAKAILEQVISMNSGGFWEYDSRASLAIITKNTQQGLNALKHLEAVNMSDSEPLFYWAGLFSMLGDKEGAFRMLNKAVDNGYYNYPYFINNTFLDPIRDTAEFNQIINRVKYKHNEFKTKL